MTTTPLQTFAIRQENLINGSQNTNYGSKHGDPTHVWVPVENTRNGESKHHVVDRVSSKSGKGSTLTAHSIRYKVKVKSKTCCGGTQDKEILKNIE